MESAFNVDAALELYRFFPRAAEGFARELGLPPSAGASLGLSPGRTVLERALHDANVDAASAHRVQERSVAIFTQLTGVLGPIGNLASHIVSEGMGERDQRLRATAGLVGDGRRPLLSVRR